MSQRGILNPNSNRTRKRGALQPPEKVFVSDGRRGLAVEIKRDTFTGLFDQAAYEQISLGALIARVLDQAVKEDALAEGDGR